MKYAVMTFMYNGWTKGENGSNEKLLEIIGEAGAHGVEAFCNHFFDNKPMIDAYKQGMNNTGLIMPAMDLIANLACPNKLEREKAYGTMKKGLEIGVEFKTSIIQVAGCKLIDDTTPEDGRKLIAEALMDFVKDFEKCGISLAFENFNMAPQLICSADDCLDILSKCCEKVKFVFDTGNFQAAQELAEDNFDRLYKHTCLFHFKDLQVLDCNGGCAGVSFGTGIINNQAIALKMKQANYNGWVSLESYPQNGNGPKETVVVELDRLKSYFT